MTEDENNLIENGNNLVENENNLIEHESNLIEHGNQPMQIVIILFFLRFAWKMPPDRKLFYYSVLFFFVLIICFNHYRAGRAAWPKTYLRRFVL